MMARTYQEHCSLVIFDCDGVLVDSEPIANRILADALSLEGLTMTAEEAADAFVGLSMTTVIERAEARLGRALGSGFLARVEERTFAAFARELKPVRGVSAALAALPALACVASSGEPEKIRLSLSLTGLLRHFEGRMFSASEVARGKPYPDLFLHAAASLGAAPEACVVVEDSLPGIEAARAAGMRALGFAGLRPALAPRLAAAGAEVFADMTELPGLLAQKEPGPIKARQVYRED